MNINAHQECPYPETIILIYTSGPTGTLVCIQQIERPICLHLPFLLLMSSARQDVLSQPKVYCAYLFSPPCSSQDIVLEKQTETTPKTKSQCRGVNMDQEGLPTCRHPEQVWEDPRNSNCKVMRPTHRMRNNSPDLSSWFLGYGDQTQYKGKYLWKRWTGVWKAPTSCTERYSREMSPWQNTLPLNSAFWNPIHFPTQNSESVQWCTFLQSPHLALTLASSLLPRHSAAIFIIMCNTYVEHQLFLWVFVTYCLLPERSWAPWGQCPWFTHLSFPIDTDHLT